MSGTDGDATRGDGPRTAWRTIMLVVMAVLGVTVLGALIVTLGEANRQRDRALSLQRHSYEVMILSRTLSGTIARAEASLGRYVISGDKGLGRQYVNEWQLAGSQINRLDQVTQDNGPQQALIDALRLAYAQRGAELSLIALSTNYHKNAQALALYYKARAAPSLTRIDILLERIIDGEHALLDDRTGAALRSVARSTTAARVLSGFGFLIVLGAVALGWLTVQALGQRASARAEAEVERDRAAELERAVARATAELREKESKLRQVQKMEAVGQLTGGIAHDFNNMLAVVLGGLELAKRQIGIDPGAAERHIDSATEGANRAAALTRRLLTFSREEALQSEAIEPGALVAGMSDLLDRTLGDRITVTIHHSGSGWLIWSDRHQLENVLLNLAVNARDAMEGCGELTITTAGTVLSAGAVGTCAAGDYVMIAVGDTGCGMTPDMLERAFEPFFTTKSAGQGTGLGLSQVFAFVRQAEGEIMLRSDVGEGTTVTLYLPRHVASGTGSVNDSVAHAAPAPQAALDVLVVEDDPRVLSATVRALEELGHRPVACDNPIAAATMVDALPRVDLVVSDVLMPQQTGPEMIAALLPRHPHLAVLFVTGYAGETGEAAFGGHHVLRKPFTIAALERAVSEAMAASLARDLDETDSIAAE